jgi:hypothetical protein
MRLSAIPFFIFHHGHYEHFILPFVVTSSDDLYGYDVLGWPIPSLSEVKAKWKGMRVEM